MSGPAPDVVAKPLQAVIRRAEPASKHPVIREVARQYGKHELLVIMRWGLQHGTSILAKSSNPAHIKACLEACMAISILHAACGHACKLPMLVYACCRGCCRPHTNIDWTSYAGALLTLPGCGACKHADTKERVLG